jgi:ferredoxin--NADP+ reductase
VVRLLQAYARNEAIRQIDLVFHFEARPLRIEGAGRVERAVFARGDGTLTLPADLVIGCIGYRARGYGGDAPALDGTFYRNEAGRIAERLYAVGWAARGSTGVIPNNRNDGVAVAKRIASEVKAEAREGSAGLDRLLAQRGVRALDHAACRRIEAAEIAAAAAPAPRRKFQTIADMLAALS